MIGSAALTNRIDRLVARGLVSREAVPDDRRRLHVTLTDDGRHLVDATIEGHVRNQRAMVAALPAEDADRLNETLRALLISLGDVR